MQTIEVQELKEKIDNQTTDHFILIDVRKPDEYKSCNIKGSISIPIDELHYRMNELDQDQEIIIICQHGIRSMQAATLLENSGFRNVTNVSGGIRAWALQIDPKMKKI